MSRQAVPKSLKPLTASRPPVTTSLQPVTTSLQPVSMFSQPVTTSFPSVSTSHQSVANPTSFIAYVPPAESKRPAARHKERTKKMSTLEIGTALTALETTGLLAVSQDNVNASSLPIDLSRSMPTASASVQPHQQLEQSTGRSQETQGDHNATVQASNDDDNNDNDNQALTWAGRNPTKPIIQKQQRRSRKGQNDEARKIRENEQRERHITMAEEIQAAQDQFHQELTDIAMKYDRTFEAIVNMVSYSTKYKKKRAPSLYLARLSAKADEVNQDKPIGDKVPLLRIREMVQEEEEASGCSELTKDEKDTLLERLKEKRETKVQGARADREGAAEDCRQVVDRLNQEINNLAHRTGAHFVGFLSRSDIHDKFAPALISDSSASLKFFKRVIGISAEDILVKYEQFFCAQSLNMNAREDPGAVRSECTELIAKGLRWPMGIKFEKLSNLKNLQDLRRLRDALQTTACKWIRMSKKEVEEHDKDMKQREVAGETVRRKRWQRSDANMTKPQRKGKGKSGGDDDGNARENEGDEIDSGSDSELARPNKRQRTKKKVVYRSRSIIDDEDDSDEQ
ncbi:hypothetical protein EDD18DRAFT_1103543 [Armillaria luteobubalina]|uniref:Uncharacterized protein n=1 Tax=Armillaria luteobubalina TaxID=153913 RepID=A0AA39TS40_9AGAR|nr:hypothetical protein EDD18DRAFT_1103543 [Armillaria luteobubalina]